jgi:hypothetical protein
MLQPLPLALVVGAAGAWPAVMAIGEQVAEPAARAGDPGTVPRPTATAVPRSATMTLECTAPAGLHAGAEGPLRLTCQVHGLELVLYSLEGMPRFWETVDPFATPARGAAPVPGGGAPAEREVHPVRGGGVDDLIDPMDGGTLIAGRTVVPTRELLDPYAEDPPRPRADDLLDPFVGRPPAPPPLPNDVAGEDPDGVVPLPR